MFILGCNVSFVRHHFAILARGCWCCKMAESPLHRPRMPCDAGRGCAPLRLRPQHFVRLIVVYPESLSTSSSSSSFHSLLRNEHNLLLGTDATTGPVVILVIECSNNLISRLIWKPNTVRTLCKNLLMKKKFEADIFVFFWKFSILMVKKQSLTNNKPQ